jgi:hypothetical protein
MSLGLVKVRARLCVLALIELILVSAGSSSELSASAMPNGGDNAVRVRFAASSLPSGAVGSAYFGTFGVVGGTAPYTFTVVSGALPSGLSLSSSTGVISGTPTASGQFSFTGHVSDSSTPPETGQAALSISVNPRNGLVINPPLPPDGTVGTSYSATLTATGGRPPYSWTVPSGRLPAGLSLSTAGMIRGTPTSAARSYLTLQVTDSSSPPQKAAETLSIGISAAGAPLTISSASLPNGTVGTAYSSTLTASGGTNPYAWTVTSGTLPAGLSLSRGGTISGTPTGAGQSNFTVQVTDSSSPTHEATKPFSISIIASVPPLTIATAALPNGIVGTTYSASLTASGGTNPYAWTVTSGALPAGLSLSRGGTISGTPTSAGQSNFTVQATDSSSPAQNATRLFSISIIASVPPPTITTAALPNGMVGTTYSSSLTVTGGTTPYSWTLVAGALPAGLSLSVGGTISGTPSSAGQSNFTVQVTDSSTPVQQASKAFSPSILGKLAITGTIKPNAIDGVLYSSTDQASGGVPAYTWSVAAGALPPGLTLGAVTGTISGTPNQDGTFNFTLKVVDSGSPVQSAIQADTITVVTSTNTAWTLQPTAVGWQFVAPDQSVTCKYNGLGLVDDTPLGSHTSTVLAKYGSSWANWAFQQSARMRSLGFNAADWYSYRYYRNWPTGGVPYVDSIPSSEYAIRDSGDGPLGSWHAKDAMYIPNPRGMKCGASIYQGSGTVDPYDPAWATATTAMMAAFGGGTNGYPSQSHAMAAILDETDSMVCYTEANNPHYSHADCGYVIAAQNPTAAHSPGWAGGRFTYTDHELYAKQAMRDFLKTKYSDSISALNAAWGTSYTTFDTSDAGGLAGITAGTYSSWGIGTGFLDENGTNIISSSQSCGGANGNGSTQGLDAWGKTAQVKIDADAFVAAMAATYASTLRTAWLAGCGSTCPPAILPFYDGPYTPSTASVYEAAAPYTDIFMVAPYAYTSVGAVQTEVQNIINADGGKPVIYENYLIANPNSFADTACAASSYQDCQSTQPLRGTLWASLDNSVLRLKNPGGKYAVIGFSHWELYDYATQGNNTGLFTPSDNGYDGSAASTATSSGSCATNHSYTQPAICQDSNGDYEGLAVASCTSGASSPTWNPNFNGNTNDGSCTWFNEGSYPPNPESANWGNGLAPIVNFNTGDICDP